MKTRIKIGMPVIINHFDRPCTRLVAIVREITNDGRLRQWQDDEDSEFEVRDSAYELWFNFREKN